MADDPLTAITGSATPLVVLSPHPDDAVLSCGALLSAVRRPSAVTVMTVFTEAAPPPYTVSARQYLRRTGAAHADELYAERRAEDRAVLERLGVAPFHAGFVDGLFRRRNDPGRWRDRASRLLPELGHVYPTYRLHLSCGRVSPRDLETLHRVVDTIREVVARDQGLLLAPLGVGGHADHVLVRTAAALSGLPAVYYSDFPYSLRAAADPGFTGRLAATEASWEQGLEAKAELIRGYRTQVDALFPGGRIPRVPEVYLLPAGLPDPAAREAGGAP